MAVQRLSPFMSRGPQAAVDVDAWHHEAGKASESGMTKDVDKPVIHGEPSVDRIVRKRENPAA